MNTNSYKHNYNINDLTDGRLTWPYRATQMNAIHDTFIFKITYIFNMNYISQRYIYDLQYSI